MKFDLGYPCHEANSARSGVRGTSLQQFFARFPDDEACAWHVFITRFGEDKQCPDCGQQGNWSLNRTRRQMVHRSCRIPISPFQGTAMRRSQISTRIWFYVMLHMANSPESLSTHFLARHIGVSLPTAHRMLARIRFHLVALDHPIAIGKPGGEVSIRVERVGGMAVPSSRRLNRAHVLLIEADGWVRTVVFDHNRPHRIRDLLMRRLAVGSQIVTTCSHTARLVLFYGNYKSPEIVVRNTSSECPSESSAIDGFLTTFR